MKVCLSIAPSTTDEAVAKLQQFRNISDIIELRIDGIKNLNLEKIFSTKHPKLIITNRRVDAGGKFTGSARDNLEILSHSAKLGVDCIDVEMSYGTNFIKRLISQNKKSKVICSYHNFERTPNNLPSIYRSMKETGAPILKIATMANDIADNKIIFDLLKRAAIEKQKLIAFCMGERGQISRILGGHYGNYLSFASTSNEKSTALGQLTFNEMIKIFHADSVSKRTKIFGLIGNPVKHSQGIYYHNRQFTKNNLNAVYVNLLVDDLKNFIYNFRDDFTGYSITMPFKQLIIPFLDTVDKDIVDLNVVNTVIKLKNKLIGYNTDFMAINTILKKITRLKNKRVVILGTGSMAKTIGYVAIMNGARATIAGRSNEKAKILADELGCLWTSIQKVKSMKPDILINATSIGMDPKVSERIVPKNIFKKNMIAFDVVCNANGTQFIKDAVDSGCKVISGEELFELQAKYQSKIFMDAIK